MEEAGTQKHPAGPLCTQQRVSTRPLTLAFPGAEVERI